MTDTITMAETESSSSTTTTAGPFTSFSRVTHIPIVESGISTLHSTLSSTPLLRTPYNLSLSISNTLVPYVQTASEHYPFAPVLSSANRAANKGLDIAQERFPYAFQSHPKQVWDDVRSAADAHVVNPVYGVAKSVDQSLAPFVDTFSNVVNKFSGEAEPSQRATAASTEEYQITRAYALIRVLKDDIVRISNDEQNAIVKNIHATLTRLMQQSSDLLTTIRSRSDHASSRAHQLAQSVLAELDKLTPLVSSLTKTTSDKLKETSCTLRTILSSDERISEKVPKVRAAVSGGVKDVVEDIASKVHEIVNDIRSTPSSSSSQASSPATTNGESYADMVKKPPE